MFKFHDDQMVKEFGIVVLPVQIWVYAKKREDFGRGRKENEFERKRV